MGTPYILPDAAYFPPARRHPRAGEIHAETVVYFTDAWPWHSSKEVPKSLLLDFARFATCSQWEPPNPLKSADFGEAIPDATYVRLLWASKVYTLLYLVDDLVEAEVRFIFSRLFHEVTLTG
jgi:hypothetical protein